MLPVMTQPPDLEARVSALEARVGDLAERVRRSEHDAAAARVLAGGADRDVADIRSEMREFREHNTRLHNATRQDLTDLRQDLNDLGTHVDDGFIELRGRLDAAAAGQQQIVAMLDTLIARGEDH
jgi:chromosome segregation ATPase